MPRDELPELLQDLLYAEEHGLLKDPVGEAAKQAAAAHVVDDLVFDLIHGPVQRHRIAQAFAGPFRMPMLWHGDLVLGLDQGGNRVIIPVQYCNAHLLTVAGSGAGKTMAARDRILQVAGKVKGCWLFDFRKREFAMLRQPLAREGIDLLVVPARKLKLNPLQVPAHVDPADFAPRVADMLVQVLGLPPRATKLLHLAILRLYRRFGVFDGGKDYPTLFDLREDVAGDDAANHPAKQAAVDSLDPVVESLGPEVLGYWFGWTTEELAKRHVAFDLSGVADVDKDLLLNALVLGEFVSRIARGISNPRMDLYICCDEAARLVSPSAAGSGMADLISLVRGTGIGLDLSVQSADVSPAILSNTANKFVGRCGSVRDYDAIGGAMGLTAEQRRWMALHLRPGQFVGQVGEGWRHPFVVEAPLLDVTGFGPLPADPTNLGDLDRMAVEECVATCPANFRDDSKQALLEAFERNTIKVLRLLFEPSAAAYAYSLDKGREELKILVYDLGGGTFDVSLAAVQGSQVTILATDGVHDLGGNDLNTPIKEGLLAEIEREFGERPSREADPLLFQELDAKAEATKISLGKRTEVPCVVGHKGKQIVVKFSQEDYHRAIDPEIARTLEAVDRVRQSAGLSYSEIGRLLMVGGSSRMPQIQKAVEHHTGLPAQVDIDPVNAVALGAALACIKEMADQGRTATVRGHTIPAPEMFMQDVTAHGVGCCVVDKSQPSKPLLNSIIIPKNTRIPCHKTDRFYLEHEDQIEARIEILQGEPGAGRDDCLLIGELLLDNLPKESKRTQRIQVEYRIDANGMVTATATDSVSGQQQTVSVDYKKGIKPKDKPKDA